MGIEFIRIPGDATVTGLDGDIWVNARQIVTIRRDVVEDKQLSLKMSNGEEITLNPEASEELLEAMGLKPSR